MHLYGGQNCATFYSTAFGLVAADTRQEFACLRNLTDIRVGLGWDYCFCRSRLALQLAWEHRLWLDYNQYLRFTETFNINNLPNSSALSLYGLTFKAGYFF